MTKLIRTAGYTGILFAALAAAVPALHSAEAGRGAREGEAVVTRLGATASAVTYWVNEADGWHVVTTVDLSAGEDVAQKDHAIVRFASLLLPGQSQLISVPVPPGEKQPLLRIRRVADRMVVEPDPASLD
jgi:hypothetical protein